jgi:hypothetical protein
LGLQNLVPDEMREERQPKMKKRIVFDEDNEEESPF